MCTARMGEEGECACAMTARLNDYGCMWLNDFLVRGCTAWVGMGLLLMIVLVMNVEWLECKGNARIRGFVLGDGCMC